MKHVTASFKTKSVTDLQYMLYTLVSRYMRGMHSKITLHSVILLLFNIMSILKIRVKAIYLYFFYSVTIFQSIKRYAQWLEILVPNPQHSFLSLTLPQNLILALLFCYTEFSFCKCSFLNSADFAGVNLYRLFPF